MRPAVLMLALLAAACGNQLSPSEKAAEDARDVAMVEAAQKVQPPVRAVGPQPIVQADRDRYNLGGPGCSFTPDSAAAPILLIAESRGAMKTSDGLVVLAADSGSTELPFKARARYSGRGHWLQVTRGAGEDGDAPASITIRDRFDRIVYFSAGRLNCGPDQA